MQFPDPELPKPPHYIRTVHSKLGMLTNQLTVYSNNIDYYK